MSINLNQTVRDLLAERRAFHSEADLKHSLARAIQAFSPSLDVRPEFPVRGLTRDMYLDIFILDKTAEIRFGIELKYKTRAASFNVGVETFTLKNHGASDINCYLFIKDICRLEKLIIDDVIDEGYAVLVTNDPSYKLNSHRETNASAFRIYHGRNLNGTLMWGPKTGAGTMKGNEDPLELRNAYRLKWDELTSGNHPEPSFHGLIVQVTK